MISLTVKENHKSQRYTFSENVVIGFGSPDISLPIHTLQREHVKISVDGSIYFVQNLANDPYVTLNGLPFGKRSLKEGDRLVIHEVEIVLEKINSNPIESTSLSADKGLKELLERKMAPPKPENPSFQEEKSWDSPQSDELFFRESSWVDESEKKISKPEKEPWEHEEWNEEDIEALVQEIETMNLPLSQEVNEQVQELPPDLLEDEFTSSVLQPSSNLSKKDEPSSYFPYGSIPQEKATDSSFLLDAIKAGKKQIALLLFAFLVGVGLLLVAAFFVFSERSEEEELQAARGVSDSAMALLYAQMHQLRPQNQNWSDQVFLKDSLIPILAAKYYPLCDLDSQGRLKDCPYFLRIYTSQDMSRFFLVAQPAPSLMGSLIPKRAIALDSQQMTLHEIRDIKVLNRLLINTSTLDGAKALEVSELVQQGKVIPLAVLGNNKEYREFVPPIGLAYVRPKAENLVYNAPRYYKLTESVVDQSALKSLSGDEVLGFVDKIKRLSILPNLVFYTTKGEQTARQAYETITEQDPSQNILISTLILDADKRIVEGRLFQVDDGVGVESNAESKVAIEEDLPSAPLTPKEVDPVSPSIWYKEIVNLANERKNALTPISQEMILLLQDHNQEVNPHFKEKFREILLNYDAVDMQQQDKICKSLQEIYKDFAKKNPRASSRKFISYVKAAGI